VLTGRGEGRHVPVHGMKRYWVVAVCIQSFLTLKLDGGKLSCQLHSSDAGDRLWNPLNGTMGGRRLQCGCCRERRIFYP
jgi:hypothetical protein